MAVFVGLLLTAFGLVSVFKTEWMARVEEFRRSIFTRQEPIDIEMSDTWYAIQRIGGGTLGLFGLLILVLELS